MTDKQLMVKAIYRSGIANKVKLPTEFDEVNCLLGFAVLRVGSIFGGLESFSSFLFNNLNELGTGDGVMKR